MAQLHTFTEFVNESLYDPTVIGDTACVTRDAQRMAALFHETEEAIRRAQVAGERTVGQILEVPSVELEIVDVTTPATDNRAQDYFEQMLALDATQLEAKAA